jgi:hypothetical protein
VRVVVYVPQKSAAPRAAAAKPSSAKVATGGSSRTSPAKPSGKATAKAPTPKASR